MIAVLFLFGYCTECKQFKLYLYTKLILITARTTMRCLAQHSRDRAICMLQAGEPVHNVTQHFGCSRVAIYDLQMFSRHKVNLGSAKKLCSGNSAKSRSSDSSNPPP